MKKLVLGTVAAFAVVALATTAGAQSVRKPAKEPNGCSLARCERIQQSQGWCPSETRVWCPRHMAMGDACTPVPSGRTGKPAC
ncbi:hypothetical protein [Bradyrhizobium japonicum]|uniref:hypothetical protein n=1 Tax=Bradyrhizobium japonicum TaxID=375 RepID=UPI002714A466|nr:hypothetical protein [Bradyrhizobium japonicum]WLB57436.1 hypothetical protein QIH94_16030 [Bradyrhizobium japonicum]